MSRLSHHRRHQNRTFGIAPLPRGPFAPVTIHARTSADLFERNAAPVDLVRSA